MNVLDLFSGVGLFSLGLKRAGFQTIAFVEISPWCRKILRRHWPNARIYNDVQFVTQARLAADGIRPDIVCGGFPCQDISVAGYGEGLAGARSGLWWDFARIIDGVTPPGSSSKTSRPFVLADWIACSGASLRSGMMLCGTVFPLPPLAPLTGGTASGLLPTPRAEGHDAMGKDASRSLIVAARNWPTPTARCHTGPSATETRLAGKCGPDLQTAVRTWATQTARDWRSGKVSQTTLDRNSRPLSEQAADQDGGSLNPEWVEWLMGCPIGWTDCMPSVTASSRKSQKRLEEQSQACLAL